MEKKQEPSRFQLNQSLICRPVTKITKTKKIKEDLRYLVIFLIGAINTGTRSPHKIIPDQISSHGGEYWNGSYYFLIKFGI